jgi:hypothetical protein
MDQITNPPQAAAPTIVNENFDCLAWAAVYGYRASTSTSLTWGYYGGRWGGFVVADGTLTLSNATNYVTVARSTGVISVNTSITNWNTPASHMRVYQITAAGNVVTAVQDHRAGPNGVHGWPTA